MSRRRTADSGAAGFAGDVRNGRTLDGSNWTNGVWGGETSPFPEEVTGQISGGSVAYAAGGGTVYGNELVPINPMTGWRYRMDVRSESATGLLYVGLIEYDRDQRFITSGLWMPFVGATRARLTAPLTPGDTTVSVDSTAGWNVAGPYRRILVNKGRYNDGRAMPDGYSQFVTTTDYTAGAIAPTSIPLGFAWNIANPDRVDGVWPVGTELINASLGGDYLYCLAFSYVPVSTAWRRFTLDFVSPRDLRNYTLAGQLLNLHPATTGVRPILFSSGQVAGVLTRFTNVSIREIP